MVELQCRFCQKTFSKGEHLRRHERSHTGARPFVCAYCQRAFGRQDSLLRHERLHARSDSAKHAQLHLSASPRRPSHPRTPESLSSTGTPTRNSSLNSVAEGHTSISSEKPSAYSDIPVSQDTQPQSQLNPLSSPAYLGFDLVWPDSEDLFQSIISDAPNQFQVPLGTLPFVPEFGSTGPGTAISVGTPSSFDDRPASIGEIPSGANHQAVHDVSSMIASLSSSVTAAVASTPITSVFLDECLHMFFVKFIPVFPVLHRATFVFRECTQALLLNAIAIGSLYLGPKSSVAKGEVLWRLAHTAIATSWQSLITHKGPYDSCPGVQLLVTALLGQVYGLLSKNRTIRTSSRAFHALAFYWANHCGMYDCEPYQTVSLPSINAPESEKNHQWRTWVAREIQQRALLAHYTIDGLIAQMSGESTSARHSANQLGLPSSEACFAAETATEWLHCMHNEPVQQTTFRSIFKLFFSPSDDGRWYSYALSSFSLRVLLEAFQSLIADCSADDDDEDNAIGVPTKTEIRRALVRIHDLIMQTATLSSAERGELILRWHSICLDAVIPSSQLCRYICTRYSIPQHLWPSPNSAASTTTTIRGLRSKPQPGSNGGTSTSTSTNTNINSNSSAHNPLDPALWASTADGRRALLHAVAIQDLVEQLPRGRAHAIHMPSSLFAAATIYSVFALAGISTVSFPTVVDWKDVLCGLDDPCAALAELSGSKLRSETVRYICGEGAGGSGSGSGSGGGGGGFGGTSRNLLYEFNSMQKLFRCLSTQWGVAFDMEEVVDRWNTLCH